MSRIVIAFLFLAHACFGTTYVVSTTGNDGTGTGSYASPVLTVNKGLSLVNPGDTLVIQPGTYYSGAYVTTTRAGTPASPITILATNNAFLTGCGINIDHSNYIVSGLMLSNNFYGNQFLPTACIIGTNADYTVVSNCWSMNQTDISSFSIREGPNATPGPYYDPMYSAHDCRIVNCVVSNMFSRQAFYVHGSNNWVYGCSAFNLQSSDWMQAWGRSNRFFGNFVTNFTMVEGAGNHPDIFQTYGGNRGLATPDYDQYPMFDSTDIICENNQFWDCSVAICEMTWDCTNYYGVSVQPIQVGGWIFRNNLFVRCGNEGISASASSIDVPNCTWENNTFVECATNASSDVLGFVYYSPTNMSPGNPTWRGVATNSIVRNNAFIRCGTSGGIGWYAKYYQDAGVTQRSTDLTADYNYVVGWNGTAWTAKTGFSETHGLNPGTDPKLVDFVNRGYYGAYRPMAGSALIDAGYNNSAAVPGDFEGLPRLKGASEDIGFLEFDPNLAMHFDFDLNPIGSNRIVDATGYGHDAVQMDSTNFVQLAGSPNGTRSALGKIVGLAPLGYDYTWYGAVTNLGGLHRIDFLTNGTFACWVLKATNDSARWDTIVDTGYSPPSASVSNAATNSWTISYGFSDLRENNTTSFVFRVYGTNTTLNDLQNPGIQVSWPGPPKDGVTWAHLAVVWRGLGPNGLGSNDVVLYYNGVPWSTNKLGCTYLRVSGSPATPWMALNIQTHDGTPQWADGDNYPNYGANKGQMDEVRLYDVALDPTNIVALASRSSAIMSGGAGGGGGGGGGGSPTWSKAIHGTGILGKGTW